MKKPFPKNRLIGVSGILLIGVWLIGVRGYIADRSDGIWLIGVRGILLMVVRGRC